MDLFSPFKISISKIKTNIPFTRFPKPVTTFFYTLSKAVLKSSQDLEKNTPVLKINNSLLTKPFSVNCINKFVSCMPLKFYLPCALKFLTHLHAVKTQVLKYSESNYDSIPPLKKLYRPQDKSWNERPECKNKKPCTKDTKPPRADEEYEKKHGPRDIKPLTNIFSDKNRKFSKYSPHYTTKIYNTYFSPMHPVYKKYRRLNTITPPWKETKRFLHSIKKPKKSKTKFRTRSVTLREKEYDKFAQRDVEFEDIRAQTEGTCKPKVRNIDLPLSKCPRVKLPGCCVPVTTICRLPKNCFKCQKVDPPYKSYSECKDPDKEKIKNECNLCPKKLVICVPKKRRRKCPEPH